MPLTAAASLLDALKATPILRPAQLQELERDGLGGFSEARALAQYLLERGWLTPYQVNQLLLERGAELVLGPYVLIERLGEGFGGQVFKTRHQLMNRIVALRLIRKELLADQQAISQFYSQVEAASKLDHENVIHAYDAGPIGATHFLATEFVTGTDLGKLVRDQGPLPIDLACAYICQAALGLQHGADHRLTHRGLTPSKLIVTQGGKADSGGDKSEPTSTDRVGIVKITDLGLGRLLRTREAAASDAGCYRAPEQKVDGAAVDIRTDIFSLGQVFFYLLAGKATSSPALALEQLRADVPAELSAILARMTATTPTDRYASPLEVAQALQPFVPVTPSEDRAANELSLSHTPIAPSRRKKSQGDAWRWLIYVMASAAVLVGGVAVLHALLKSNTAAPPTAIAGESPARTALNKLQARAKDSRANLAELWPEFVRFRVQNPGTPETIEAGEWLARLASPLDRLDPQRVSAEDRAAAGNIPELVGVLGQQTWHSWWPIRAVAYMPEGNQLIVAIEGQMIICDAATGARQTVLQGPQKVITSIALSPDGARLVSGSHPGKSVRVWDVASGKEVASFACGAEVDAVAVSPDKKWVAASVKGGVIHVWSPADKKEKNKLGGLKTSISALAFSPDGEALAAGGQDGSVRRWNFADGKDVTPMPGHQGPVHTVVFSPDGALVASGGQDEHLRINDAASGKGLQRIKQAGGPVVLARFSADGASVSAVGTTASVQVWEASSGKELAKFANAHAAALTTAAFSPDGQTLAGAGASHVVRVWHLADGQAKPAPRPGHSRPLTAVAFSPDGEALATASQDHTVRLWDIASAKARLALTGHNSPVWAVRFAPDGQSLASGGDDKSVRLWDATTGSPLRVFGSFATAVHTVDISPDGLTIAAGAEGGNVRMWDVTTKAEKQLPPAASHTKPVRGLAVAADGHTLASAGLDQSARLWDFSAGSERCRVRGEPGDYTALALAADGQSLALAGTSRVIRLHDARTGREVTRLPGLNTNVVSLAYSFDGTMLASAEADGQVILWQLGSNRRLRTWHMPGPVHGIAFAPDSRHLATANSNGTAYILRVAPRPPMPR